MAALYIRALYHRRNEKGSGTRTLWTRRYRDITTAAAKATSYLIVNGCVGDVIEFTLVINEMQIGAMKMTSSGKLHTEWNPAEASALIKQVLTENASIAASKLVALEAKKKPARRKKAA